MILLCSNRKRWPKRVWEIKESKRWRPKLLSLSYHITLFVNFLSLEIGNKVLLNRFLNNKNLLVNTECRVDANGNCVSSFHTTKEEKNNVPFFIKKESHLKKQPSFNILINNFLYISWAETLKIRCHWIDSKTKKIFWWIPTKCRVDFKRNCVSSFHTTKEEKNNVTFFIKNESHLKKQPPFSILMDLNRLNSTSSNCNVLLLYRVLTSAIWRDRCIWTDACYSFICVVR